MHEDSHLEMDYEDRQSQTYWHDPLEDEWFDPWIDEDDEEEDHYWGEDD